MNKQVEEDEGKEVEEENAIPCKHQRRRSLCSLPQEPNRPQIQGRTPMTTPLWKEEKRRMVTIER